MKTNKNSIPKTGRFLLIWIAALATSTVFGQESEGSILITGVKIHTGTGNVIDQGAVGIKEGKIDFVGPANQANNTAYSEQKQYNGAELYPGLIATNTSLGLNEIDAVRATRDYREVGNFKPNVRSIIAYNAESNVVSTVLSNGVMFAQVCPQGGTIKGTSSVMKLKGWNWEDATYNTDEGICMDWPSMYKRSKEEGHKHTLVPDEKYVDKIAEIKRFFAEADAYAKRSNPLDRDLKYEAMRGVFDGSKTLYITADFIKEIREIIGFKRDLEIMKLCIVGGRDAWMCGALLKENEISVAISRVHSLPRYAADPVDAPFTLPAQLSAAGVKFCFQMGGDMETAQNRNLPFNIGTAIAYGLDYETAVRAATLNAAEILGIAQKTGSIEVGKDANLVISQGDIFDMRTSIIEDMYLQGKALDLSNRQEELYKRYKAKYEAPIE